MANLNYKNSIADTDVISKTRPVVREVNNESIFDSVSLYVPLSLADGNINENAYDRNSILSLGFGVIEITYENYEDIFEGELLSQYGLAFNDGSNVEMKIYLIIVDDTGFTPAVADKSISWANLSKAFKVCYNFSTLKTLFSSDYTGETDTEYFDKALCLASLCESENEFSQFRVYVKLTEPPVLETKKIADVNKDTEHLPTTSLENGDYVEADGDSADFPFTIDGVEFTQIGQRAYYNSRSTSWGASPAVDDSNTCKVFSYSRTEEIKHCVSLNTSAEDRANYFYGYLLLIAPKSAFYEGNTLPIIPVLLSHKYMLPADNNTGRIGLNSAYKRLSYNGLKPSGNKNILNSEVNNNLDSFYYSRLVEKGIIFPVSINENSMNECAVRRDKDISFYPLSAREINHYIDYTIKNAIAKWWTDNKGNVLCNEATYKTIQSIASGVVLQFVSIDMLESPVFSFPPFSKAKQGNSIIASGAWSATYVLGLEKTIVTGQIDVDLVRED